MNTILGDYYYSGIKYNLSLYENDSNIFDKLDEFITTHQGQTILIFISYDLKNDIEALTSDNKDFINFPIIRCIVPRRISSANEFNFNKKIKNSPISFMPEIDRSKYISIVNKIKSHIQKGDIYETNFCYNWSSNSKIHNPFLIYKKLEELTNAPYKFYAEIDNHVIMSASPELFLKKEGNKLISKPIKGTSKRGEEAEIDKKLAENLKIDPKERTENIMIVDLVRNDLSRIAVKNSVSVEELCKVYTFKNIHQMISKVSCHIDESIGFSEILKSTFPMGSMTGVPKIKAMELMDNYEISKRGLYSGSVGIIKPNGDFELNVIIRTFMYNKINDYISFKVGSAITINSDPEKEYDETLTKADALIKACC